ncbi:hypothetical protein GJ744_002289 [Endocarpon pusillum]|uniref:Fungal N-terminal domain-containing protein n=1 Tax=Endocarpon pusillum TaxID=364733 RepID=A0A8H7E7H0_9EURO|nr:hypothetical protein GJ744_002289 [Endocarpon pusillum]
MIEPITTALALAAVIAASVSAFKDGKSLLSKWRRKKATGQQNCQQCDELDRALNRSATDIQRDFGQLSCALGPKFACGDKDSIHAIQMSLTKFNRTLIQALKAALGQNVMVNLRQLLNTTRTLHEDIVSNMTSLSNRVKLSHPIQRSVCHQNNTSIEDRSSSVLEPSAPLPAFEDYAAAPIPDYTPLDTIPGLRRNLDTISTISSNAQHTAEGLRETLKALSVQSEQSIRQVAVENLPSEILVQARLRALSRSP